MLTKVGLWIYHHNLLSSCHCFTKQRTVSCRRPDYNPVHTLHGRGGVARWPHRHHLPGKAVLLWIPSFPQIPPWIRLLPHCGEKRGIQHQHSQQHQHLHQHQHQHQQAASPQGLHLFFLFPHIRMNSGEKLWLIANISEVIFLAHNK